VLSDTFRQTGVLEAAPAARIFPLCPRDVAANLAFPPPGAWTVFGPDFLMGVEPLAAFEILARGRVDWLQMGEPIRQGVA